MAELKNKNEEKKGFEKPALPQSMMKKKRYEYTQLVAVHDLDKEQNMAHFVGVGWDRKLHIWDDDR